MAKILVLGPRNGTLPPFLPKLAALHSKNQFTLGLVLGDLFSDKLTPEEEALLTGDVKVPFPIYFSLGKRPLPPKILEKVESQAGEVCENLYFLGNRGSLNTAEGVRIVFLGGTLDAGIVSAESGNAPKTSPVYTERDCAGLKGAANTRVDILVTNEWPAGVFSGSKLEGETKDVVGRECIADLAARLKPKYHLVPAEGKFLEREPYINGEDSFTRFIALAEAGNAAKAKSVYAFNLTVGDDSGSRPDIFTASPYSDVPSAKRRKANDGGSNSFFWGDQTNRGDRDDRRRRGGNKHAQKRPPPGPESCFFCLSNPNLEKHLIVSIGDEAYLTTAKGPLPLPTEKLQFPAHILIIPLSHSPFLGVLPAETRDSTLEEMKKYKSALEVLVEGFGYVAVTFEVSRGHRGVHTFWQVVPVPKEKEDKIYDTFVAELGKDGLGKPVEIQEGADEPEGEYFRWWVGEKGWILNLPDAGYFDLQFGRRVLGEILGLRERTNWKQCSQTQEEEVKDAEAFKKAFRKLDFTLQ